MDNTPTYRDYTDNVAFQESYFRFQDQWRNRIPESEKILIDLVRTISQTASTSGGPSSLLDVGCSTGNFLLHLRQQLPALDLHGVDLAVNVVERNQGDPSLAGIAFTRQDMLTLDMDRRFDIVTCNKTLPFFSEGEFGTVIGNIARVLKPGGALVIFDWFHLFHQDLEIIDRCDLHPYGLRLFVRSYRLVGRALKNHGFDRIEFTPFEIPIDMPMPANPADVSTFTVRTDAGKRLQFRGGMYQPWCFTTARLDKPSGIR